MNAVKERTLVMYQDTQEINRELTNFSQAEQHFNTIVSEAKKAGVTLNSMDEVEQCISDPAGYLKLRIASGQASLGAIKFDVKKLSDLVELPDLKTLTSAVTSVKRLLESKVHASQFKIERGTVKASDHVISQIRKMFSITATTPKQIELFEKLQAVCDQLNEIAESYPLLNVNQNDPEKYITFNLRSRKFEPTAINIKRVRDPKIKT